MIQLGYPKAQVPKISQELRQKAVAAQFSCSYEDIRSRLAAERASVFENEMSGSGWRTVQDHLTLGSLSKKGTAKLFMIASLEKEVAAAEVKELSQLQIARVVKSAPTATEGRR